MTGCNSEEFLELINMKKITKVVAIASTPQSWIVRFKRKGDKQFHTLFKLTEDTPRTFKNPATLLAHLKTLGINRITLNPSKT